MTILERLIKRRRKRIVSFLNKLSLLYDEDPDYFADDPEPEPELEQEAMTVEPEPKQEAMTVEPKPKQKTLMIEPEQPVSEIKSPEPVIVEFQYGKEAITLSEIIERAKKACGNKAGTLNIYIKPEENRVYFASGASAGSFEI